MKNTQHFEKSKSETQLFSIVASNTDLLNTLIILTIALMGEKLLQLTFRHKIKNVSKKIKNYVLKATGFYVQTSSYRAENRATNDKTNQKAAK